MERTLGKARILQLYLALAPWGGDACGAEQAAHRYLGKPAAAVNPLEAAWLAGLLRNPDRDLGHLADRGAIDRERTAWVLAQMRPMAARRRAYWLARVDEYRPQGPVIAQQQETDYKSRDGCLPIATAPQEP
jgi:membrane carboxypeptidase/penicillin-binding protein PbpC